MTAREPDPIPEVKPCPKCQQAMRTALSIEYVAGKPWYCEPCRLFASGTATEFLSYRSFEIALAAERAASAPTRPTQGDERP